MNFKELKEIAKSHQEKKIYPFIELIDGEKYTIRLLNENSKEKKIRKETIFNLPCELQNGEKRYLGLNENKLHMFNNALEVAGFDMEQLANDGVFFTFKYFINNKSGGKRGDFTVDNPKNGSKIEVTKEVTNDNKTIKANSEVLCPQEEEEVVIDPVQSIFDTYCKSCKNDYEISCMFRTLLGDKRMQEFNDAILALSKENQVILNDIVGKLNKNAINKVKWFIERNTK